MRHQNFEKLKNSKDVMIMKEKIWKTIKAAKQSERSLKVIRSELPIR